MVDRRGQSEGRPQAMASFVCGRWIRRTIRMRKEHSRSPACASIACEARVTADPALVTRPRLSMRWLARINVHARSRTGDSWHSGATHVATGAHVLPWPLFSLPRGQATSAILHRLRMRAEGRSRSGALRSDIDPALELECVTRLIELEVVTSHGCGACICRWPTIHSAVREVRSVPTAEISALACASIADSMFACMERPESERGWISGADRPLTSFTIAPARVAPNPRRSWIPSITIHQLINLGDQSWKSAIRKATHVEQGQCGSKP